MSQWFASRRINSKIMLIVGALAVVATLVGIVGIISTRAVQQSGDRIYSESLQPVKELDKVKVLFYMRRLELLAHVTAPDAASREAIEVKAQDLGEQMSQALETYAGYDQGRHAEEIKEVQRLIGLYDESIASEYLEASRNGDLAEIDRIRSETLTPVTNQLMETIDSIVASQDAQGVEVRESALTTSHQALWTIAGVLVAGLVLAVALALYVARLIVRPLRKVENVVLGLAEGDLTRSAEVTTSDEVGRMAQALDTAMETLRTTVAHLAGGGRHLAEFSEQMLGVSTRLADTSAQTASGIQAVASTSEEVSRNIQTVASGGEEMTASIQEISNNATQAARVSQNAVDVANQTSESMRQLDQSSGEIGAVVKVITAIAEQTNLLALNATIEAARAGESGKGFAVVASEVKDLAQATGRATEDISNQIHHIQQNTGSTVEMIRMIAEVITEVNDASGAIAAAVEEQTATTGEMNRGINQVAMDASEIAHNISQVSTAADTTTSAAEEARAVATELAAMARDTRERLSVFHLADV